MRRLGALTALAIVATLAAPAALGAAPARTAPVSMGVRRITVTFVDTTRPTPANSAAHVEAATSRTLPTTIWIPRAKGPFPLVVYAHGNGGSGAGSAGIADPWARAGFVVAAPSFPVSSRDGGSFAGVADVTSQPGDLSFVITRVLALSRRKGPLHGKVDARHIGVAGHSLGAITTLGLVERSCCSDARVDAAISISGAPLVGGTDFTGAGPPLLLIHGDHDPTVHYAGSTSSYELAAPPKYLLTVLGGLHGDFLAGGTSPARDIVARTMVDFWNAYLEADHAALARLPTDSTPGLTTMQADPGVKAARATRAVIRVGRKPRPRQYVVSALPKGITLAPHANAEKVVTDLESLAPVDEVQPGDIQTSPLPTN